MMIFVQDVMRVSVANSFSKVGNGLDHKVSMNWCGYENNIFLCLCISGYFQTSISSSTEDVPARLPIENKPSIVRLRFHLA